MMKKVEIKPGVLQDFSLDVLCDAIQRNRRALHAFGCNRPEADVRDDEEVSWCITSLREPFFNCVYRTEIKRGHSDDVIEEAMSQATSRGVGLWWFIGLDTRPAGIAKNLKARGFKPDEVTGMALDLTRIDTGICRLTEMEIKPVTDLETLQTWCRIAVTGFEMPEEIKGDWFQWYSDIGLDLEGPVLHFLGWWKGEPVATSSLLLAEGVAGIYNVATVPQMRRHGAGFDITCEPLKIARRSGYRVAILQASKQGRSVYRKIGFKDCCKLMSYVWEPG
jgi:hypothetical protein